MCSIFVERAAHFWFGDDGGCISKVGGIHGSTNTFYPSVSIVKVAVCA